MHWRLLHTILFCCQRWNADVYKGKRQNRKYNNIFFRLYHQTKWIFPVTAGFSKVRLQLILIFRREQWPLFSSYACWQQLVTQTRNLSRDHVALSEVYSTHLVSRLSQVMEDVQRIYKRVRYHISFLSRAAFIC